MGMSEKEIRKKLESRIDDFRAAKEELNENDKISILGHDYYTFSDWLYDYIYVFSKDEHHKAKKLELSNLWVEERDYFLFFDDGTIEYHYTNYQDDVKIKLGGDDYELMSNIRKDCLGCW